MNPDGTQGADNVDGNGDAVPSADGSVVAFYNYLASTLGGAGNTLLRKDLASGALATLDVDWQGQIVGINPPNPSISDDASRVAFTALSPRPLVQHPNEHQTDSLIFDTSSHGLASVCLSSTAEYGDALCENVKISGDGRWATFDSYASNLDSQGANGFQHIFVTDVGAVLDLIFYDAFEP